MKTLLVAGACLALFGINAAFADDMSGNASASGSAAVSGTDTTSGAASVPADTHTSGVDVPSGS